MSSFSSFERKISSFLNGFPLVRSRLKSVYQHINYLTHGRGMPSIWLDPAVSIQTPSELAGLEEPQPPLAEFFGYFDASPWSLDGRYYVTHVSSDPTLRTEVVVYDLEKKSRSVIATTQAATWQQGAMARWINFEGRCCLAHNVIERSTLGTSLYFPGESTRRFLPLPLQAANEAFGLIYSINYLRLAANGTEYGYLGRTTNLRPNLPDREDGIWAIDIRSGAYSLILSLAHLRETRTTKDLANSCSHEINHVSVAPDGRRLVFIHRFRGARGQFSRLYAAKYDGSDLQLLLDEDMTSHYTWLSPNVLLAWARTSSQGDRYYLIDVSQGGVSPFPVENANKWGDGHPSFCGRTQWIVTDSYPDRARQQRLFLMRPDGPCRTIGSFLLPLQFRGDRRVDLHPRWSPDGALISIDAGWSRLRRNYIVDVSSLTC